MNGIQGKAKLESAQNANRHTGTGKRYPKKQKLEGYMFGQMYVLKYKGGGRYLVRCSVCKNMEIRLRDNIIRSLKNQVGICKICGDCTKHNMSNHPAYKVWEGMIRRCHNKKHEAYKNYGGRGIFVCEDWKKSPEDFIIWLEKNGWSKGLEIDRKNNNLGYSPKNCHIVTSTQNKNNTSYNVHVFLNKEKVTISQASRITGINESTIRERFRRGWNNDELFMKPRKYIKNDRF